MWLFAIWPLRQQVRLRWRPRTFVQRYLTLGPLFVLLFYIGRRTGLGPMTAAQAGMALLALLVLSRTPNLGRLLIFGSAGFSLFYTTALAVCFALWPQLGTQWNAANLSGLLVWIIPGEEIAWAFTAGGAFPLVMAYALDADLGSRSVHSDRSQSRLCLAEPPPPPAG